MIGRTITLILCAAAFWAGMKFQTYRLSAACASASGTPNSSGLCIGATP